MMRTGNNSSLDPGFDFSILDMIKAGGDNRILDKYNNPFNPLSSCDAHSLCLILPAMALINVSEIKKMLGNFYIHEIFELGTCYLGHNEEPYFFWFISKDPVETIKVSIFYKDSHPEDSSRFGSTLKLPSSYTNSFLEYISLLDNWHKGFTKMPASEEHKYEFNEINAEEFVPTRAYARYYRKENDDIRKLLTKTFVVPLKDVADVVDSLWGCDPQAKQFTPARVIQASTIPEYPFDYEKHTVKWPFSKKMLMEKERLHKNDIILYKKASLECFLLNTEPQNDLYCIGTIIRAKKVTPEYLFLYLRSATAKRLWEELNISVGYGSASLGGVQQHPFDIPVVLPQKPDDYYIEKFQEFSTPNEHHYLKQSTIPPVTMEDVLNRETINDICSHNSSLIRKQVLEDIEELNICFSNKAYKATLILCGSILEAVLIDWLSEIDGVNYFKNKITAKRAKKDKNGQSVVDSEGNPVFERVTIQYLDQYINTIKEIKDPDWDAEAECARQIKEKRNLVHAKACLKQDARITESTCELVIEHLKTVLRSRGLQ